MENVVNVEETTPVVSEESTPSTEVTTSEEGAPVAEVEASTPSTEPEIEKKSDAQERIRQLVARQREAERKAAYLEGQLEALKKPVAPEGVVAGKPTAEKFASYDEYIEAVSDWNARKAYHEEHTKFMQAQEAEKTKAAESTRKQKFSEQMDKARTRHEDFDDVTLLNPDLKMTAAMLETIEESDHGADVAYYLGKNPSEAARISQLPPLSAAKEIGKLEMKFSSPAVVPVKRVTSAAPPVGTVGGNVASTVDTSKMSDSEWYAYEKAEKAKKLTASNRR
mgnify:CR=1 FL=1